MDRIRISDLARLGTATDTLDASINNVSDPCAVEEPNISAMSLHGESDDDQKRGHLLPNACSANLNLS